MLALAPLPSAASAVMVHSPDFFAVTFPSSSTLATAMLLLIHFSAGLVASRGVTVAETLRLFPSVTARDLLSNATFLTAVITVTCALALTPDPSPAVQVMVVDPVPTPVTTPLEETLAISGSADVQTTLGLLASSGPTLQAMVYVLPLPTSNSVLSSVMESTGLSTFT